MNPIDLAQEVEDRYRRYLETTFYFGDPDLRASFKAALRSGHLSKGPYIEATPLFKRTLTPCELFGELLGFEPDDGFLSAVKGDRLLWAHQEKAIRKVFGEGRNVVVATGTASGKTEAFIDPILLHMYREFQDAGELAPGVRALILYPMNVLANDQRERIGEMCRALQDAKSPFRFTFGQYIGETPEDPDDSWRHARDHINARLPGELVLRSEMREAPPHILLTNYSMLEYLLIRPYDSPLFDDGRGASWAFLVLDEAHQYRGSRGIEMGMLVRRLKQRVHEGGREEPLRCIATSATLAAGEGDRDAVAGFAQELFGEVFDGKDVVMGETEETDWVGEYELSPEDYGALGRAVESESVDEATQIIRALGLEHSGLGSVETMVGRALQNDKRSLRLRQMMTRQPQDINTAAGETFSEIVDSRERLTAVLELVELLIRARDPSSKAPLLSARYHFFLRSLEGAFISYVPERQILLDRRSKQDDAAVFEIALCRECGQYYLVGKYRSSRLQEAIRDPGDPHFGATFFRPIQDEQAEDERSDAGGAKLLRVCVRCGAMWSARQRPLAGDCAHTDSILVEQQQDAEEREDQVPRCSACGYQAPDPVREVVHGTDGPHAVIATTLAQLLPEARRKVLAFADSRQQAAFFAWYLDSSYKDILGRNLILATARSLIEHAPEGLSLQELATGLRDIYRQGKVFPPDTGDIELRRRAWISLYREFLADEPRISLEGVGLLEWTMKWPNESAVPHCLLESPWSLSEEHARDLMIVLLNTMRMDRGVEVETEPGISVSWGDIGLRARQMSFRIGPPRKQRNTRSWDGRRTRRAHLLAKALCAKGFSQDNAMERAVEALREVWQWLGQADQTMRSGHGILLAVDDARRLNPGWWRARPLASDGVVYQCDTCDRVYSSGVLGVCPRHKCPGKLAAIPLAELEENHYRRLYEAELPRELRVEEHTAQIDKEKAREFQRDFKRGNIHVLSCSTTFELGVDLGDLDCIFLRNVPPEAFNYAQRVGRSGRTSGFPGFAITFCRRSPHDLYHFSEPERMLAGQIRPPTVSLRNEKIIVRHMLAAALSHFFRQYQSRFENVENLFANLQEPTGLTDFHAFLESHEQQLRCSLEAIVPAEMVQEVGLSGREWIERATGEESRFARVQLEAQNDFTSVNGLEMRSRNEGDYRTAQWAQTRARTIAEEDVLSFLSRKAVIPKYGFPVDVVELDPHRTQRSAKSLEVLLQRDLAIAIAEFAPTARLVANKMEWTSYGVKKIVGKEWPRKYYRRCPRHNLFVSWEVDQPETAARCCEHMIEGKYLIPQFGFVTDRTGPKEPVGRVPRVFATRPYFVGLAGPDRGQVEFHDVLSLTKASPGEMVVLCEGRRGEGFYICKSCGAGFRQPTTPHKTPHGEHCNGTLELCSLGHEFISDVIQLRFRLPSVGDEAEPIWFAYSLAYALVEGAAETLEVPSVDLSTTVAYGGSSGIPPIVLYDNVPGGAGLVARLEDERMLRECLEASLNRVSGSCGCQESTSCYGCLRSYRNQFAHQYLRRGDAKKGLEEVLARWRR